MRRNLTHAGTTSRKSMQMERDAKPDRTVNLTTLELYPKPSLRRCPARVEKKGDGKGQPKKKGSNDEKGKGSGKNKQVDKTKPQRVYFCTKFAKEGACDNEQCPYPHLTNEEVEKRREEAKRIASNFQKSRESEEGKGCRRRQEQEGRRQRKGETGMTSREP